MLVGTWIDGQITTGTWVLKGAAVYEVSVEGRSLIVKNIIVYVRIYYCVSYFNVIGSCFGLWVFLNVAVVAVVVLFPLGYLVVVVGMYE